MGEYISKGTAPLWSSSPQDRTRESTIGVFCILLLAINSIGNSVVVMLFIIASHHRHTPPVENL